MLRKILGAFKTSPIAAMEIEASILPVEIRFEKICQNYAYRALLLGQNHPIRNRVPESFPFSNNEEIEINWDRYLDWNQEDQRNIKRYSIQLYRVLNSIANAIPSLNIKNKGFKKWAPWKENPIKFEASKIDSTEQQHNQEIKEILLNKGIIGYPAGSKLGNQKTGVGLYLVNGLKGNTETKAMKHSWYLGLNQEIIDAELLAIFKALSEALKIINRTPNNPGKDTKIYIYTESYTAIQRLQKIQDLGPGRDIVQKCTIVAQSLQNKGIKTILRRIPKSSKIQGNIIADDLAKKGAKSISNSENPISLYYIRRRLNQSIKEKWICDWDKNKKDRHYL
jgi:ribonuclease HI